jgi:hypothetical protein
MTLSLSTMDILTPAETALALKNIDKQFDGQIDEHYPAWNGSRHFGAVD